MTKRIIALLLTALMALLTLAACGGSDQDSKPESAEAESSEAVSEDVFLPEAKNWEGKTVTILAPAGHAFSTIVVPEEMNDEPINDAFYERNSFIEQEYGIKLVLETCGNANEGVERIRNNVETNLDDIDIVSIPLTYIAPLGAEGKLYDINSIENGYLHIDQPWWDQTAVRDLTINNKLWFLAGDALIEDDEATWAIYFNKKLVESYHTEDPYSLVRNGTWTLDKYHELASQVHLMHGGQMSYDPEVGDVFGALAQSVDSYYFMLGAGQPIVAKDGDQLRFRITDELNMTTFNKVMDIMLDETNVGVADFYGRWDSGVYGQEGKIFVNGNALFYPGAISTVGGESMREADIEYGILPMPKYGEEQEDYTTPVNVYWCQVLAIPTSNSKNLDVTCYALEAMAYYGMKLVTPEYYTRTLTLKRFQDYESADMLDIIFRHRTFDLAAIFDFGTVNNNGAGTLYFYTSLLGSKSRNITSQWDGKSALFQSALDEFIAQVNK